MPPAPAGEVSLYETCFSKQERESANRKNWRSYSDVWMHGMKQKKEG